MRVLLLGSDTPLGKALTDYLELLGRQEAVGMSRSACRWKSERQAKKEVRRAACAVHLTSLFAVSIALFASV